MEEGVSVIYIINRAIQDKLTIEIDYINRKGEKSTRILSDVSHNKQYGNGYISAYCHLKEEERTFKISNISEAKIVPKQDLRITKQVRDYDFDGTKPIFNLYGERY